MFKDCISFWKEFVKHPTCSNPQLNSIDAIGEDCGRQGGRVHCDRKFNSGHRLRNTAWFTVTAFNQEPTGEGGLLPFPRQMHKTLQTVEPAHLSGWLLVMMPYFRFRTSTTVWTWARKTFVSPCSWSNKKTCVLVFVFGLACQTSHHN